MPLRVGLVLNTEQEPGEAPPRWPDVRTLAQTAEDAGFASLWAVDHFVWESDPWGRSALPEPLGVWEAWTTLAAVAEATTRVTVGTLVTCAGYRNPAVLAKIASTLDEISDGRVILGIGAGDYPREHDMFGIPTDRPFARFEEALRIIAPLLRTGQADAEGEFHRVRDCRLLPHGAARAGPPIMIGTLSPGPRSLRLVAQYADVWNGWLAGVGGAELVPPLRRAIDTACETHGRDPTTLRRTVAVAVSFGGPTLGRDGFLSGSTNELAAQLAALADEGIEEVHVRLFPNDTATVERFADVLQKL